MTRTLKTRTLKTRALKTRALKLGLALLSGAALLALGAAPLQANHFQRISPKHTLYGVSQYNYLTTAEEPRDLLYLLNPNHVTQIAAMLFYQRPTPDFPDVDPEVFLGCLVKKLTPNGAIGILEQEWLDALFGGVDDDSVPPYVEVIWGPRKKVTIKVDGVEKTRRLADGLGGFTVPTGGKNRGGRAMSGLAHPKSFSLPLNKVVAGQREVAIACICAELGALAVSGETFQPFGVKCP